jgi:hypothetical protein
MGKRIALALGAVVGVLLVVVALQPSPFSIERSALIEAPAHVVYGHIQNLRAMDAWSPFAKMDPQMKIAYEGPEAGVGARSSWEGPQMGKGSLAVIGVKPDQEVEMTLEMLSPMPATNRILFTLAPQGQATRVTWRMEGSRNFVAKAIGLFVSMEKMVGGPFEQGLASLKAVAEDEARRLAAE